MGEENLEHIERVAKRVSSKQFIDGHDGKQRSQAQHSPPSQLVILVGKLCEGIQTLWYDQLICVDIKSIGSQQAGGQVVNHYEDTAPKRNDVLLGNLFAHKSQMKCLCGGDRPLKSATTAKWLGNNTVEVPSFCCLQCNIAHRFFAMSTVIPLNEHTYPLTHTYPNWGHGYREADSDEFPPPVLAGVTTAIVEAAPDIAGIWKVTEVFGRISGRMLEDEESHSQSEEDEEEHTVGWPIEHPHVGFTQRIELAGSRTVITTTGSHKVIHDMICDATVENGVYDVSGRDHKTVVKATAEYIHDRKRGKVHVMRPVTSRLKRISRLMTVERWREGDKMLWKYGLCTMHLERVDGVSSDISDTCADAHTSLEEGTIPKAHTYPYWGHGYSMSKGFPLPSLGPICHLPIVSQAPDIAGVWKIVDVETRVGKRKLEDDDEGWPMKHPPRDLLQKIEQAGSRVAITTGGAEPPHRVIHDMICDGSIEGCADDVNGRDHVTHIRATGKFIEDKRGKVHVLCPMFTHVDRPIPGMEVERWREGDRLIWKYGLYRMSCERVDREVSSEVDDADGDGEKSKKRLKVLP